MEHQTNPTAPAKITALGTVVGACLGALATIGSAYLNILKPTESQIVSSIQYKALVDESAQKTVMLGELQQTIKQLGFEQHRLKEALQQAQKMPTPIAAAAPSPQQVVNSPIPAQQPEQVTAAQPTATPKTEVHQRSAPAPTIDPKTLHGRWVGIAECKGRDYPVSIDISASSRTELKAVYSDSLNGQKNDATLLIVPAGASRPSTLSFRTYEDRFIVMKNGHRLELKDTGELVTFGEAANNCSLLLSKS